MLIIHAVLDCNGQDVYFPYEKIEAFGPYQGEQQRYWIEVAGERYTLRGTVDLILRQIPATV